MNHETMTCLDIIDHLVGNRSDIDRVRFIRFESYLAIQQRITAPAVQDIITDALSVRAALKLPFWDSFNVSLFGRKLASFDFLNEVKFHNQPQEVVSVKQDTLHNFLSSLDRSEYLTFNSQVSMKDGHLMHIPLLDFHIPVSPENEQICLHILKELGCSGYLLNSGKSYHFYGDQLLTEEQLVNLLSFSLLFSPIIDRAWIAHQLIERSSCLRISERYSTLPYLVQKV